jgi:hypothetical protein
MLDVLARIAAQCDGVRCDMAMLVLPDVIARTWGERAGPADGTPAVEASFWTEAIDFVHDIRPEFTFMAEAYWDLEWTLQRQGFDYTYDKRLYDRLHARDARAVREHLHADPEFQRRSARFLENHDEPRAAAVFPGPVGPAAATIALLVPGLRFLHQGQREGRRLRTSNHLGRRAPEPVDAALDAFYGRLLEVLRRPEVRNGEWRLLEPHAAWEGNPTVDGFVAFTWQEGDARLLVAVNYADTQAQCYVRPALDGLGGRTWRLRDLLHPDVEYRRAGDDLLGGGLYLDMPPWGHHVFEFGDSRL